ncbi:hypothetical protein V6N13_049890 [Hibiscus sabdariffa]|uniref:Uncharacterized protein n=1 Tax=Hibiscus sabdariffa TaxID=183260 RepID=A0ABR2QW16_9ROSI
MVGRWPVVETGIDPTTSVSALENPSSLRSQKPVLDGREPERRFGVSEINQIPEPLKILGGRGAYKPSTSKIKLSRLSSRLQLESL